MKGFVDDIEKLTEENDDFRRVLYTGKHLQLVLMTLRPGEEIGEEVHEDRDQFFRVVDLCVNNLPAKPARVFSMKEFLECDDRWERRHRSARKVKTPSHQTILPAFEIIANTCRSARACRA